MRTLKLTSLLLLTAMVLSACGGAAGGGAIKVAILAPLSGPVPTFGVSTRDGALLAIDEWNAKGGVLGKKITPIVEDSQCTPDPAVNAANKVIDQDKVHYIIGEVCSKASIPVTEIANAKKVLQISPTSTNVDVTVSKDGKTKDYIFRACFIDPFQGQVGAKFALETLKAKNAFIMLDQSNDYVVGLANAFEKTFTAGGGKIVGKESYTATDTDFSAILAKVAAAKPDLIYLPDYYNIVNLATKQAKERASRRRSWAAMAGIPRTWTSRQPRVDTLRTTTRPTAPRQKPWPSSRTMAPSTRMTRASPRFRMLWQPWPTTPPICCSSPSRTPARMTRPR